MTEIRVYQGGGEMPGVGDLVYASLTCDIYRLASPLGPTTYQPGGAHRDWSAELAGDASDADGDDYGSVDSLDGEEIADCHAVVQEVAV